MATLGQLYNTKESGVTVKKTHMVPLSSIYIEEGFNIRDIDWEHVDEFKQAFIDGEYTPPLFVEVTEKGVKVIDGHHRYLGAIKASEEGHEIARLECKDFTGSEADKIAFMITSSQGKPLSPVERAIAYHRLINQGFTAEEIAKKVKRSVSDVHKHLQLAECEQPIQEMVKAKELNFHDALSLQKEHGVKATEIAKEAVIEAKAQGKSKATFKKFNYKKSYSTLSAEVLTLLESIEVHLNCEQSQDSALEVLTRVHLKLSQTMRIITSDAWNEVKENGTKKSE